MLYHTVVQVERSVYVGADDNELFYPPATISFCSLF